MSQYIMYIIYVYSMLLYKYYYFKNFTPFVLSINTLTDIRIIISYTKFELLEIQQKN